MLYSLNVDNHYNFIIIVGVLTDKGTGSADQGQYLKPHLLGYDQGLWVLDGFTSSMIVKTDDVSLGLEDCIFQRC